MQIPITYCCRTALTTDPALPYQDKICSVCGTVYGRNEIVAAQAGVMASIAAAGVALGIMSDATHCLVDGLVQCPTHWPQFQQAVTKCMNKNVIRRDMANNSMLTCVAHGRYLQNCPACQALLPTAAI